jgi:hypothetical protein
LGEKRILNGKPVLWNGTKWVSYSNDEKEKLAFEKKNPGATLYRKQGGGYIGKKSPRNISSLSSYPSYSSEGGMMIAIQPMIIEKPVSVPSGQNRSIIFPIPVGVNNSNMQSLSRG